MRFAEPVKFLFLPEMGLSSSQASTKTKSTKSHQYVLMKVDFLHNVVSALKARFINIKVIKHLKIILLWVKVGSFQGELIWFIWFSD